MSTSGKLEITNTAATATTLLLDGDSATITAGAQGYIGDLILRDQNNHERVRLGRITEQTFAPQSTHSTIVADYVGLRIMDSNGKNVVQLGRTPEVHNPAIQTSASTDFSLILGGGEKSGTISLLNAEQVETIRLDGKQGSVLVRVQGKPVIQLSIAATTESLYSGGPPLPELGGALSLATTGGKQRINLDAASAKANVGGNGRDGELFLYKGENSVAVHLGGSRNDVTLYGASTKKNSIELDGNGRTITIKDHLGNDSVVLDGTQGDIILTNADCAEDFEIGDSGDISPGTVMVLDSSGRLRRSERSYDTAVAGVISGAGDFKPGIVLGKQHSSEKRLPIALVGKVYCRVDADYAPIAPGDALTTSPTPGHAMKATEPSKSLGCLLGKALHPLKEGQGLIPILVALQ